MDLGRRIGGSGSSSATGTGKYTAAFDAMFADEASRW
jgi:hypothetical protein